MAENKTKERKEPNHESEIVEVWAHNIEEEMLRIAHLLPRYCIISMDTEFPGCFLTREQMGTTDSYLFIKGNVDQLNLIQLGITLSDEEGNLPHPVSTWQFNLKFDIS